jgi:hypothetical protein
MAFKEKLDSGGGDSVKFNKIGDTVTGVYLGSQPVPEGKYGPTTKHLFKTEEGMRTVWAKPNSQLGNLLSGEEGNELKVTFAESKPSGKGNPQKIFKVSINDAFERLDSAYLLSNESDEQYAEEPLPTKTVTSRDTVLAKLQAAKRKA